MGTVKKTNPSGRGRPPERVVSSYTPFRVADCGRCPALVLTGLVVGLRRQVSTRTVSRAHAAVLWRYGVSVLIATRRQEGLFADFWSPGTSRLSLTKQFLLVPHVCGAPADRRIK